MKKFCQILSIAVLGAFASCTSNNKSTSSTDSTTSSTVVTSTAPGARYIRYNVNSAQGQKSLQDMQKAMSIMRKLDCSNPTSWYYQGAIHWVPSIVSPNPYCGSYKDSTNIKDGWDNCTHTLADTLARINFLTWHRLYIYHFEKIVRKLSGDPNFAIPYWNYTATTSLDSNRTLPKLLRDTISSLFTQSRYKELNQGQPLTGEITKVLNTKKLFEYRDFFAFSKTLEQYIHGGMHNYIGAGNNNHYMIFNEIYQKIFDGGLMANVPSAGFDPVFWLHHSNIDRIWQQWTNSARGQKITLQDIKDHPVAYKFFDENGKVVVYTPKMVSEIIYNLDYDFDDTKTSQPSVNTKQVLSSVLLSKQVPEDTIVNKVIKKPVVGKSTTFQVANQHKQNNALLSAPNKIGAPKSVVVKVTVSITKEPRGIFEVYINLPKGTTPDVNGNYFAGFMSFFGTMHHAGMKGMAMGGKPKASETFYFDLTDEFAATGALSKPNFDVSILNSSGKGAGEFTVERVEVIVK